MSALETADKAVESLIENLVAEYEKEGFLSTPTAERKAEIIEQIAKLRASLSPQITNK